MGRPVSSVSWSRPGRSSRTSPRNLLTRKPATSRWSCRRHERDRAVQRGEDPAAVDVAHHHDREPGRGGQAHVGDVVGAQVDLGGGAGALADDDVEARPQVGQAGQHLLHQRRLPRPVGQRRHLGHRPPEHDDLAGVLAARLEQHRVHRRLGLHARRRGLHHLGAADLRAVGGDHRVVAHVLRLERRHRDALADQPAADPGGDEGLAGVGGGAGDEQRSAHPAVPGGSPQPAFS